MDTLLPIVSFLVSSSPETFVNPFTTGNPFLGTKLLAFSIGRGSGALKGLKKIAGLGGGLS